MRRAQHVMAHRGFTSGKQRANGALLGIAPLQGPTGFARLAKDTIKNLDAQVLLARSLPIKPAKPLLRALDDISQTLSFTLDTAELCRNVHPDAAWREAADAAFSVVADYVHQLNADSSLHARAAAASESGEELGEEEHEVLQSLLVDAHAGGVLAPPDQRPHIVALQQRAGRLGARFAQLCAAPAMPTTGRRVTDTSLLRSSPLPAVRRAAYIQMYTPAPGAEACLEELLSTRAELAKSVGEASFAHLTLRSKVLGTPEAVQALLSSLSDALKPHAENELKVLRAAKRSNELFPWDRHYYAQLVTQRHAGAALSELSNYLPLPSCVHALQLLAQKLFGLSLERVDALPGELWHPSVQKYHLTDPKASAALRGVLYLDLHSRYDKIPGAANFVICNASQLSNGQPRMPRVALVASFNGAVLSHTELETLLHEAGHSFACLLSRTAYQTVSGVRCAADWVETPSTLMENYAWDYRFLSLFARHIRTGASLPIDLWNSVASQRHAFAALNLQEQLFLAATDQALHAASPLPSSPTQITHSLETRYTSFASVPNTAPQTRFAHLYNYPASYYAYVFSRVCAAALWQRLLASEPLSSSAGRLLNEEVLAFGGARNPRTILKRLVGGMPDVNALLQELKYTSTL